MNKRMAILLTLADVPPPWGLKMSELAGCTPWVPAALYGDVYALEREGLVGVNRRKQPMIVGLVEHPDLAAMRGDGITVPDDREDA